MKVLACWEISRNGIGRGSRQRVECRVEMVVELGLVVAVEMVLEMRRGQEIKRTQQNRARGQGVELPLAIHSQVVRQNCFQH